jgi:hypothetical protein
MAIVTDALHENTCVYVQVEYFLGIYKNVVFFCYFYKWHAYMYEGLINDN